MRRFVGIFALVALVSGCGGGGGGGSVPVTKPAGPSGTLVPVKLTFTIPAPKAAARQPETIDPGTASIGIAVNALPAQYINASAGTGGCSTGPTITCTETVNVPTGNDTFTVTTYSGTLGTGYALNRGTQVLNVLTDNPNSLSIALGPVVSNNLDSGPGSLRNAVNNANAGDTITFVLATPATITLLSPLSLSANVNIHGPGVSQLTVNTSAAGGIQVLGATVSIDNVAFGGQACSGGSGCIVNNAGTLSLTNDSFSGGIASGSGGAIYSTGPLTVMNSTFSGNSAVSGGGAIFLASGSATISSDTFQNNSTQNNGGALDLAVAATMANDTFTANTAGDLTAHTGFGGAIYVAPTLSQTISNSTFTQNQALSCPSCMNYGNGGAIYGASTSALTLSSDTFGASGLPSSGNGAMGGYGAYGGAVDAIGTLSGNANHFYYNSVNSSVGSTSYGGAVYVVGSLNDSNSLYDHNTAGSTSPSGNSGAGGAINANNGTITSDTFTNNSAIGGSSGTGNGGAICTAGSFTVNTSVFGGSGNGNIATTGGAGFYGMGSVADLISETTIDSNTITGTGSNLIQGAGVYLASGTNLQIDKSTISNNVLSGSTNAQGGGLYNAGTATITDSTFYGNNTSFNGGGIYNSATATITQSTIVHNSATNQGGNLENQLSSGNATIMGDIFAYGTTPAGSGVYNNFILMSNDYNVLQTSIGGGISGTTTHNSALDPMLSASAALNGSTYGPWTYAPITPNGVLDGTEPYTLGCNGSSISTDERGNFRNPVGNSHLGFCTIGAYEDP